MFAAVCACAAHAAGADSLRHVDSLIGTEGSGSQYGGMMPYTKAYYGLQVSTNPQTIRLFVNDPKLATPAYLAFIERNIRARFGLEGAPLRIFMKARTRKTAANAGQPS